MYNGVAQIRTVSTALIFALAHRKVLRRMPTPSGLSNWACTWAFVFPGVGRPIWMGVPIYLNDGYITIVDKEDYPHLIQFTWRVSKTKNGLYAKGYVRRKQVLLHRYLLKPKMDDEVVHHINNCGLDNRRCNLQLASYSENNAGRAKRRGSKSRFKGVEPAPKGKRGWYARILSRTKRVYLGYFVSEEDAAHAYDSAAVELHGQFARLNFPQEKA